MQIVEAVSLGSCVAATPLVFTVMMLHCAYLRKILALGGKRDQGIQRSRPIELCVLLYVL